jgi:predicted aldo/keto reductase-like oxidoreductase
VAKSEKAEPSLLAEQEGVVRDYTLWELGGSLKASSLGDGWTWMADQLPFLWLAIDMGVTFLDNAWEYHSGRSEDLMGKVRFIGFTGHRDPLLHLKMPAYGYPWDAVQMPMNVLDPHFKSFQTPVLPVLVRRNIGVIARKTMGSGYVLRANAATPEEALRYVWSQPVSTLVSGMESDQLLATNVALARHFSPMSTEEQAALLTRTKEAGLTGKFEPFKTAPNFDGPIGRRLHGVT